MAATAADIAQRFVERINAHDVEGLVALMTPNHRFVDSLGVATHGQAALRAAWQGYFRMVPDYALTIERTLADHDDVVLLGIARGTYSPDGTLRPVNAWEAPVALRARVRDGRVAEWRVYADNEPIRARMRGPSA